MQDIIQFLHQRENCTLTSQCIGQIRKVWIKIVAVRYAGISQGRT